MGHFGVMMQKFGLALDDIRFIWADDMADDTFNTMLCNCSLLFQKKWRERVQ